MKLRTLVALGLVFVLIGAVQAAEQRGALVLNKIPIYDSYSTLPIKLSWIKCTSSIIGAVRKGPLSTNTFTK